MILLDIINLNDTEIIKNKEFNIKFNNNYHDHNEYNNQYNKYNNIIDNDIGNDNDNDDSQSNNIKFNIFNKNILKNDIFKKKIKVISLLGEGSYGIVYKIKIDSKYYALKLNSNELPEKLEERYNTLMECENLKKYIINIYVAGKIRNNDKYDFFCIMEYGGKTLRNIYHNLDSHIIKNIIKQLFNIIYISSKFKFLMTDLKLSNITCNSNYEIKLIDIYMFCENYSPCFKCKIVRTYSTIEIEKEKRIYENPDYNFTCAYIPFAICIIDLICKNNMSEYCNKISNKFDLNMNIKEIKPLLQISCYNFNNNTNNFIKEYKNLYKYKKKMEDSFPIIKNNDLYKYFVDIIDIKHHFFSKKKFILIINDLINLDPNQRSLKFLKYKLIS